MKRTLLLLAVALISFQANAAGQGEKNVATSEVKKLAYIVRDTGSIYSQYITDFEASCRRLGAEPMILSYEGDSTKFPAACENAVTRGANGVYTWPDDQSMADYAADYYKNLGIPHVVMGIITKKADACMVADQYSMGVELAKMANDWVEQHWGSKPFKWGILEYTKSPHVADRTRGMKEKFTALAKSGTLAAAMEAENLEKGMNQTENMLQLYPDIQLLICCEDTAAMGALEVFRSANKTGDNYAIFGACFGDQVGNAIIKGDVYRASIRFPSASESEAAGRDAPTVLMKLLNGEKVDHLQQMGFYPVTPENVRATMTMFGYAVKE
jgi:ABC-type sugar transport system substrate-binding protein